MRKTGLISKISSKNWTNRWT